MSRPSIFSGSLNLFKRSLRGISPTTIKSMSLFSFCVLPAKDPYMKAYSSNQFFKNLDISAGYLYIEGEQGGATKCPSMNSNA